MRRPRWLQCTPATWVATALVFVSLAAQAQAPVDPNMLAAAGEVTPDTALWMLQTFGLPGVWTWLAHRALRVVETGQPIKVLHVKDIDDAVEG